MKLRARYEKLYQTIFSVPFFAKILRKFPFLEKLLSWEIVSYLVFGVLTTVVNLVAYWAVNLFAGKNYEGKVLFTVKDFDFRWIYFSNAVAWVIAVTFSFVTNKLLVFESHTKDVKSVLGELIGFFGARILSFLIFEELLFGILAAFMNSWIAKIILAVFVVVFNYVASKLVIFRKKKAPEEESE
ncbi:MAG: GtrA family protein [Clostridia bacterium]|nr:GtrA family protein [Clostridia bacterium]